MNHRAEKALQVLAAGPHSVTQIIRSIGEPCSLRNMQAVLLQLVGEGVLKRFGTGNQVKYALASWTPAEAPAVTVLRQGLTFGAVVKAKPPEASWWLDLDRDTLSRRAIEELPRMRVGPAAAFVNGSFVVGGERLRTRAMI